MPHVLLLKTAPEQSGRRSDHSVGLPSGLRLHRVRDWYRRVRNITSPPFLSHPPCDTVYPLWKLLAYQTCRSISSSKATTGTPSQFLVPIQWSRAVHLLWPFGVSCRRPNTSIYS